MSAYVAISLCCPSSGRGTQPNDGSGGLLQRRPIAGLDSLREGDPPTRNSAAVAPGLGDVKLRYVTCITDHQELESFELRWRVTSHGRSLSAR